MWSSWWRKASRSPGSKPTSFSPRILRDGTATAASGGTVRGGEPDVHRWGGDPNPNAIELAVGAAPSNLLDNPAPVNPGGTSPLPLVAADLDADHELSPGGRWLLTESYDSRAFLMYVHRWIVHNRTSVRYQGGRGGGADTLARPRRRAGRRPLAVEQRAVPRLDGGAADLRQLDHGRGNDASADGDQHPERAYLEGVERSHVFVLLLGHGYGRSDESGYSPTHKEANRAAELHVPRLLFEPADVRRVDRDGRLNDWVASLHQQLSGNAYADPADLGDQLEARLREMASAQETPWIKLGPIVFPGQVRRQSAAGTTQFVVTARVRGQAVRRTLAELSGWPRRANADRLTYRSGSWPVEVVDVAVESATLSADEVTITCRLARDRHSSGIGGFGGITLTGQGRSVGPPEHAELWATQAVFGGDLPRSVDDFVRSMTTPEGSTLPAVLRELGAQGWLAEGLARLCVVEWLTWKFGGEFEHLDVGPATATGVRIDAAFRPTGFDRPTASIVGGVPLIAGR